MTKRLLLSLTLTAGLLGLYLWISSPDPVEALINELAADFSFEEPLHPIALMAFARATAELAEDPLQVQVQYQGEDYVREVSQGTLVNQVAALRRALRQLAMSVQRLQVDYQGASEAIATLEVRAMGKRQVDDEYFLEVFEVEASLVRGPEGWRFSTVRAVDLRHEAP